MGVVTPWRVITASVGANRPMRLYYYSPRSKAPSAMENSKFPVQFDEKCYDLNKFLHDHPGGMDTLKTYKGKSIKSAMLKFGHSTSAYHILNDFKLCSEGEVLKDVNLTGAVSGNGRILTKEEDLRAVQEIAFLEELESRLDWSKPILDQLQMIAPHYSKWVNSAVYRRCRLFSNPLLEAMSYTPWYLVPMFWIPVICCLGITEYVKTVACEDSCAVPPLSRLQFLFQIVQGMLLWSAIEYSLHRWVFHLDPGSSLFMMKLHFIIHGVHHKVPFDSYRQVFPPGAALLIATILYYFVRLVLSYPSVKLIGALAGYLVYDMVHFYVHHGSPADGTYLYELKRYHSNHHFINHDKAFGITSKLWDYVFRTVVSVKKLGFSLHW